MFKHLLIIMASLLIALSIEAPSAVYAQGLPTMDEELEDILPGLPDLDEDEEFDDDDVDEDIDIEDEERDEDFGDTPIDIDDEEAGAGENRWGITIQGAVVMSYLFNESTDSFVITYNWVVKGEANAATAVIRGDAEIEATVEGNLSKWPTGECNLQITIPKVPFELTFRRTDDEKGSLRLVFKKALDEQWSSNCTFKDAPGAKFDTKGAPERWLNRALEKARPPLKSIVANLGDEEQTTTFLINKQIVSDVPLGSGEIEGSGVITITPGGLD